MKTTLYTIENEYIQLINQIEEADGELTPEMEEQLAINEGQLQSKSISYLEVIGSKESFIKRLKDERDRYNAMIKKEEKIVDILKVRLLSAVKVFGTFTIGFTTFGTRKSTSVEVLEVNSLPSGYKTVKVTESADKVAIGKALKDGLTIDGCRLVENVNLKIN